jgi:hypothetical protein
MARYGKKAGEKVEQTMRERKRGTLRSGSGRKVTSKKQAIAIGLAEARGRQGPSKAGAGDETRGGDACAYEARGAPEVGAPSRAASARARAAAETASRAG